MVSRRRVDLPWGDFSKAFIWLVVSRRSCSVLPFLAACIAYVIHSKNRARDAHAKDFTQKPTPGVVLSAVHLPVSATCSARRHMFPLPNWPGLNRRHNIALEQHDSPSCMPLLKASQ